MTDHAHRGARGYGAVRVDGAIVTAHRAAYIKAYGPIPPGMHVLHRCDTKGCANPEHLFLGTNADNMRDKVLKGRQARGERIHNARLTADRVRAIRAMAPFIRKPEIARIFEISPDIVYAVLSGRTWRHIA